MVNYKKRSVDLPHGCKDLIDVLQEKHAVQYYSWGGNPSPTERVLLRDESTTGGVENLERFLGMLSLEGEFEQHLTVSSTDDVLSFDFERSSNVKSSASVVCIQEQEEAVRAVFERFNLPVPVFNSSLPPMFVPDLPVYVIFPIAPTPYDVLSLAGMLRELFLECSAAAPISQLNFQYRAFGESM